LRSFLLWASPFRRWSWRRSRRGRSRAWGFLSIGVAPPPEESARYELFTSLSDLGWVAGQNSVLEFRFAEGQADRLRTLAAELVRLKIDVIVILLNQETGMSTSFGNAITAGGFLYEAADATANLWKLRPVVPR
jgi:hypothetical protein